METTGPTIQSRTDPLTPQPTTYLVTLTVIVFLGLFLAAFDALIPAVALPLIAKSLHISIGRAALGVSVGFLGTFLTGIAIGPLMDRWGRKPTFRIVLLGTALFSAFNAVVATFWQFALVRLFAGTAFGTIQSGGVLVSEEAPARRRGLMIGIVQAAFPCGNIVASFVASLYLPHGEWRPLFLFAFIPAIALIVLAGPLLRETGRYQELNRLRLAQRIAGQSADRPAYAVDVEQARRSAWTQLFAPELRRQTILVSLYGFLLNSGVNFVVVLGVTYMTLYDHISIGVAVLILLVESVASLVGQVLSGLLADFFSAKTVLAVFSFLGAIAVLLLSLHGGVTWVGFAMAGGGVFGQGILGCFPRYAADSFPTRVRGTGTSFAMAIYWLNAAFMPALYGMMMDAHQLSAVPQVAAALMALGAVSLLFARSIPPRRELEEIAV